MKTEKIKIRPGKKEIDAIGISRFEIKELKEYFKKPEVKEYSGFICIGSNNFTGTKNEEIKKIMKEAGFKKYKEFENVFYK